MVQPCPVLYVCVAYFCRLRSLCEAGGLARSVCDVTQKWPKAPLGVLLSVVCLLPSVLCGLWWSQGKPLNTFRTTLTKVVSQHVYWEQAAAMDHPPVEYSWLACAGRHYLQSCQLNLTLSVEKVNPSQSQFSNTNTLNNYTLCTGSQGSLKRNFGRVWQGCKRQ